MEKFLKSHTLEIKATDEETGIVTAYVAGFGNVDRVGDIILQGAFAKTIPSFLAEGVVLWNHDTNFPIGTPLSAVEDEKGLLVTFQLDLDDATAKRVFGRMKSGVIKKFSIGFNVIVREWITQENISAYLPADATPVQIAAALRWGAVLKEIELFEISPVSIPANPNTGIEEIKAKALADAGAAGAATSDEGAKTASIALAQARVRAVKRRQEARKRNSPAL